MASKFGVHHGGFPPIERSQESLNSTDWSKILNNSSDQPSEELSGEPRLSDLIGVPERNYYIMGCVDQKKHTNKG